MLFEFIKTNRAELIARTRARVATRAAPRPTENELERGVPLFLDQLVETLRLSRSTNDELSRSAGAHGGVLLRAGFTVAQVVHDYGDICQAVTNLAAETNTPITVDEFRTLNRCLDDAIAQAVTVYAAQRERSIADEGIQRLSSLVDEIRTRLSTAKLSFELLKQGHVGVGGSTGAILGSNLRTVCNLLDRSFSDLRLASGKDHQESVLVSELLEQVEVDGSIEADSCGLTMAFIAGEPGLRVKVDRFLITVALAGLLQNALKFSRVDGHVSLGISSRDGTVVFEIADECGGLAPDKLRDLLLPAEQRSSRTPSLGLDMARRSIESCGGRLLLRDVPGTGCVFTVELPLAEAVA
jgi:signal transduction histidine kinase